MRLFGLIGYPLSHSFSEKYFTEKFFREHISDCVYRNFPLEKIHMLPDLLTSHHNLCGLNVTIPYKQAVIPYLKSLDNTAGEVGAVNTIKIIRQKTTPVLKGYNTDVYGFEKSLMPLLNNTHRNALILGTGGAAKAVAYVLKKNAIQYKYVSRSAGGDGKLLYADITQILLMEYTLIINTSPLGMYPSTDTCPEIPYQYIGTSHVLYDLVYNPEETLFLKKGKERGAVVKNGLEMLYLQAERAWQIWNE